jgi:hypothetical protein
MDLKAFLQGECPALVAAGLLSADLSNMDNRRFWRDAEAAFVKAGQPAEFEYRNFGGRFVRRIGGGWGTGNAASHSKYDSLDGGRGLPSW